MWESRAEVIDGGRITKYVVHLDSHTVPYSEVLRLWQHDSAFREFFIAVLADSPYAAFRWETPPVTNSTDGRDFEFVLLRSDILDRPVGPQAFENHFGTGASGVVSFLNLGKDAIMVVPRPIGPHSAYGHLASFTRNAPTSQNHELWQVVGRAMEKRLSDQPVWLSTAGMGVSWLHVRLDARPKYYGYAPYRHDA